MALTINLPFNNIVYIFKRKACILYKTFYRNTNYFIVFLHSGKNTELKTSTNSLDLRKIACLTFKNVRAQKILILSTF